jgi:hypothetical protein
MLGRQNRNQEDLFIYASFSSLIPDPKILSFQLILLLFCSTFFAVSFAEESFVFVRSNVVSGCSRRT